MSQPCFLNKYEKEKRVIELHLAGKTIREIAKEVHMSFTPISNIIKACERKKELQDKRKENNQSNQKPAKKLSLSSRAFTLFSDGKTPVQVAVDLNIDFHRVRKHWTEYLRLKNMTKLYNIYIEDEFHLDYLFKINYFLLRNKIPIKDCENILRIAYDITKLYKTHSNLKAEIEKLEQIKKDYSFQILPPMQLSQDIHHGLIIIENDFSQF